MIKRPTLTLAAVIVAAATATPAQANFVSTGQADNTKVSLTTTGSTRLTYSPTAFIQCSDWTLTGSITPTNRSTLSIPVGGVVWSTCTYTSVGITVFATITDSGSDWTASVGTSAGATSFNVTLTTPTFINISIPALACTLNFPKQTFATGIVWTNSTHSLAATVTGLSYTSNCVGGIPPASTSLVLTASFSDNTLTVTA